MTERANGLWPIIIVMRFKLNTHVLILSIFLFFNINISAQKNSIFYRGEVEFSNSDIRPGFISVPVRPGDNNSIYYKESNQSIPRQYSPNEVLSFTIRKGPIKYLSDVINIDYKYLRQFMQVHLEGEYSLLSCFSGQEKIFILRDSSGGKYELINSVIFQRGKVSGSEVNFGREYRELLRDIFGSELKLQQSINELEFSTKELVGFLSQYHRLKKVDYLLYPPPSVSNYFIGAGGSVQSLQHTSEINDTFRSGSIFGGAHIFVGIEMFGNKASLCFESSFNNGIIFHDDFFVDNEATLYYEEHINSSILSLGLSSNLNLFQLGRVTPFLSAGASYSFFVDYSQSITEEILFSPQRIIISNEYVSEESPEGYPGLSIGLGTSIEINRTNSLRFELRYSKYYGNESGCQSLVGLNVGYQVNLF